VPVKHLRVRVAKRPAIASVHAGSHVAQWMPSHTHSHKPVHCQASTSLGRSEPVDGLCHSVVWSARVEHALGAEVQAPRGPESQAEEVARFFATR
jgi:hypothetical protein